MYKALIFVLLVACGGGNAECEGDHCVCPTSSDCTHDCTTGGNTCEVQCPPGHDCDVGCAAGEDCRVECSFTSSCEVDCANTSCNVTCPATGCTVTNCGADCTVACGTIGAATRNGTTATCP